MLTINRNNASSQRDVLNYMGKGHPRSFDLHQHACEKERAEWRRLAAPDLRALMSRLTHKLDPHTKTSGQTGRRPCIHAGIIA
jgi:hypothetical protein